MIYYKENKPYPNENAENRFSKTYLRLFRMKCEEYEESEN